MNPNIYELSKMTKEQYDFTVVVVFPTPPFWFTTDITLHMISSSFNFPMILFSIISTVPVFPVSSLPVYKNLENTCATARL